MTTTSHPAAKSLAERVLRATQKAAVACDRPDIVTQMDNAQRALRLGGGGVVVMGEFKQGKSTLINALLNAPVCPVDDDVATSIVTVVHHADRPQAVMYREVDSAEGRAEPIAVPVEAASQVILSGRAPSDGAIVHTLEFGLPRDLLAAGLRLIDTPGVGGMDSAHGNAAIGVLAMADGALFVTDASQELTLAEIDVLRRAVERCANVACVVSKVDLYPHWRRILERNREHLRQANLDIELFPVSSNLRAIAVRNNDVSLDTESGFPRLIAHLQDSVVRQASHVRATPVMARVVEAVDQMADSLHVEQAALNDPERAVLMRTAALDAAEQLNRLRTATARWSTVLNDGISDLRSTVDHDLRLRIRVLIDEADALIEDNDPADIAHEFFPMVEARLMAEIVASHDLIRQAAEQIAAQVDEVFESELPTTLVKRKRPAALHDSLGSLNVEIDSRPRMMASVITGMRGSYGGMVMFGGMVGALGNAIGVATFGPIGLAAGALLGRRAAVDERKRQLVQRQLQAKKGVKKHIDAINLRVVKHNRDTIQAVQRELRDANLTRATTLRVTAEDAAARAQRSAETHGRDQQARLGVISKQLEGLAYIRSAASQELAR